MNIARYLSNTFTEIKYGQIWFWYCKKLTLQPGNAEQFPCKLRGNKIVKIAGGWSKSKASFLHWFACKYHTGRYFVCKYHIDQYLLANITLANILFANITQANIRLQISQWPMFFWKYPLIRHVIVFWINPCNSVTKIE